MTSWYVLSGGGFTSKVSLSWRHKSRAEKIAERQAGLGEGGDVCSWRPWYLGVAGDVDIDSAL